MSHIFISYSKKNRDYARAFANKLLDTGFDVWIDDRIDYGEDWWQVIVKAIRECAAFVVIMTPDSDASKWVQREVTLADHLSKPMFPVLREGDLLSSDNWSMFLRTQYADVRDVDFPRDEFYTRLIRVIEPKARRGEDVIAQTLIIPALPVFPQIIKPNWAGKIIPEPFEWCFIPAGRVTLVERGGYLHEPTTFDVPEFQIARYPITNAQFEVFVTSENGWRNPEWWGYTPVAKNWWEEYTESRTPVFKGWDDAPRIYVSWYAAIAYTRWLSSVVGQSITLPTEQQWQRAAQGDDGRQYPWGNDWSSSMCNTAESGISLTTSVSAYPESGSPFGVLDLSGNVWEWCLTEYENGTGKLNSSEFDLRAMRGGSWVNKASDARVVGRARIGSASWTYNLGFRVVMSSSSS